MNVKTKSKKRRLDEAILSKARKYIKKTNDESDGSGEDDDAEVILTRSQEQEVDDILLNARSSGTTPNENELLNPSETPIKPKLRKPRHPDRKSKDKKEKVAITTEGEDQEASPKKKSKKKKRKSKKKVVPVVEKNTDLEKRFIQECLQYLNNWHKHKSLWKFEKRKQIWLLKNILNMDEIPDEDFKILVNYVGSIQGAARKATEIEMKPFMETYEAKYLGNNFGMDPPSEFETKKYNRARSIVQMLGD